MRLSCDEATKICDKNQYGEASLWDKIKLSIHIFLCKKCGLYSKQNEIMTRCYEKHTEVEKCKKDCLDEQEKKYLDKEVKAKIKV
jgi:hypothetical protein